MQVVTDSSSWKKQNRDFSLWMIKMVQTFCDDLLWSALDMILCGGREMIITKVACDRRHMG